MSLSGVIKGGSGTRKSCDACKRGKRKCDGRLPCKRCTDSGWECSYSPLVSLAKQQSLGSFTAGVPLPSPRASHPLQTGIGTADTLTLHPSAAAVLPRTTINRGWMETYFRKVNFAREFYGVTDLRQYDKVTCPAMLLQYYSAMASVARALEPDRAVATYYESAALKLAKEQLRVISLEAMTGYQLLSFHYWGQDAQKCAHFRGVVMSIGSRLACSSLLSIEDKKRLLQIVLSTVGAQDLGHQENGTNLRRVLMDFTDLIRAVAAEESLSQTDNSLTIRGTIEWLKMRANMAKCIVPLNADQISSPLSEDPQNLQRLRSSIHLTKGLLQPFRHSPCRVVSTLMEAVMLSASGDLNGGLSLLWNVVQLASESPLVLFGANSIALLHLAFRFALPCHVPLASQLNNLQRRVAETLPEAWALWKQEFELLKSQTTITQSLAGSYPFAIQPLSLPAHDIEDWEKLLEEQASSASREKELKNT